MRIQRLMTVLFLSGFIAASAAAFEVKPGEWEMEINFHRGEPHKQKICISPEDAKTYYEPAKMAGRAVPKNCKTSASPTIGGAISYQTTCENRGMKTEAKGTIKRISDNEIQSEGTMTVLLPGQKEATKSEQKGTVKKISESEIVTNTTMTSSASKEPDQITVREKYVGPACSKGAEPWPPALGK
ncbi:MAG: DUF3617 domain-containing protein [Betaproteobacteria bacterium]|nr:DUF3617 domain-containing protein [Betaproteobacteria bacterium]